MVTISEVKLSGFGSYGPKPQTLTLHGQGPVAIVGDNGAGKSTAASKGLTWALYGKCPPERMGSGTRALTGRAVVGNGQKRAMVAVSLIDFAGVHYEVKRERGRSGSDVLTLTRAGALVEGASQGDIDALIGADYDTWCRTVVRGQGDPWSFAEATDKRKREILDVISGAAKLEESEAVAKAKRVEAEAAHRRSETEAGSIQRQIDKIDLTRTQTQHAEWETRQRSKLDEVAREISVLQAAVAEARKRDEAIGDNRAEHDRIHKSAPVLDLQPYTDAVADADHEYSLAFAEFTALEDRRSRIASLALGDPCPTCTQPVGPEVAATLVKVVNARNAAETEADGARKHKAECLAAQSGAVDWLSDETKVWQKSVADLPNLTPEAPAIDRELKHAERRSADLRTVVNPYTTRLESEKMNLDRLERDLRLAREHESAARWVVEAATAWETALGSKGARAHMAEATIATIEAAANRWLSVLSDRSIEVEFPPTREVKGRVKEEIKTIVHIDGETRDLLSFSGGERRRVNLAVDLGVAAACAGGGGLAVSLLVLDEEVFSGLDEHGKAAVVHALHGAGVGDVVIIDHDPRLSSTLPRTIKVTRDAKGFSVMTEETTR